MSGIKPGRFSAVHLGQNKEIVDMAKELRTALRNIVIISNRSLGYGPLWIGSKPMQEALKLLAKADSLLDKRSNYMTSHAYIITRNGRPVVEGRSLIEAVARLEDSEPVRFAAREIVLMDCGEQVKRGDDSWGVTER